MDRLRPGSHIVSNTELYNGAGAWRLSVLYICIFFSDNGSDDWKQNYLFQLTIIKMKTE